MDNDNKQGMDRDNEVDKDRKKDMPNQGGNRNGMENK